MKEITFTVNKERTFTDPRLLLGRLVYFEVNSTEFIGFVNNNSEFPDKYFINLIAKTTATTVKDIQYLKLIRNLTKPIKMYLVELDF